MRRFTLTILWASFLVAGSARAEPEQITTSGNAGYPTVSPDGSWLAYDGPGGIWTVPATGGVSEFLAAGNNPDWSPCGDLIACSGNDELLIVDAGSGGSTTLASGQEYDRPAWSPDCTEIACTGDPSVMIITYPGGAVSSPPCTGACHGEDPDWNEDGSRFCFEDGLLLMTLPRDGGVAATLVDCGDDVAYPAWSSNGRYVAFSRDNDEHTAVNIWVVDVLSLELYRVTTGEFSDYQPAWAPQGDWIYFKSDRGGADDIWRVPFSEETALETKEWSAVKSLYRD
jgi:Tol biopolymer transport system component